MSLLDNFEQAMQILENIDKQDCIDCTEATPFKDAPLVDSRSKLFSNFISAFCTGTNHEISDYIHAEQIDAFKLAALGYFTAHGLTKSSEKVNKNNIVIDCSTFKIIENALESLSTEKEFQTTKSLSDTEESTTTKSLSDTEESTTTGSLSDAEEFTITKSFFVKKEDPTILIPVPTFGLYLNHIPENYKKDFFKSKEVDYKINADELSKYISDNKPEVMLLQNPINPSGQVLTNDELKIIASECKKAGTFVISDEIFSEITNTGKTIPSITQFMRHDKVLAIHGLGKSYGMAGARSCIAYSGNEQLVNKINYKNPCGDLPGEIIRLSTKWLKEKRNSARENYKNENTQIFNKSLQKIEKKLININKDLDLKHGKTGDGSSYIKLITPESTNVALLDFSALKGKNLLGKEVKTGNDVAESLLNGANVGFVPGEACMLPAGSMCLRIPLSPQTPIFEALDAIKSKISEKEKHTDSKSVSNDNDKTFSSRLQRAVTHVFN